MVEEGACRCEYRDKMDDRERDFTSIRHGADSGGKDRLS